MICSSRTLDQELEKIRSIIIDKSFPINVIKHTVERKIKRFKGPVVFALSSCPLYLKLP